jgi:hypothetical protein
MILPKKIDILGKRYSVKRDDTLMDDGTASGLCKPWKCEIRVGIGLDKQQKRDTLLHEAMHGIFSETALTMDFKDDDDEERIIRRMATGLLQVLRANPELVAYILEEDK